MGFWETPVLALGLAQAIDLLFQLLFHKDIINQNFSIIWMKAQNYSAWVNIFCFNKLRGYKNHYHYWVLFKWRVSCGIVGNEMHDLIPVKTERGKTKQSFLLFINLNIGKHQVKVSQWFICLQFPAFINN